MAALSAMVSLEIPQINIMTKMDLLSPKSKKEIEKYVLKVGFISSILKFNFILVFVHCIYKLTLIEGLK